MRVITKEFELESRSDTFSIIPIGDCHIGAYGADENRLIRLVQRVKNDPNCYFVGMGDYIDAINRKDKRFSVASLAKWVETKHMGDLARAQSDRFLSITKPIASKCLAMIGGNHEDAIYQHEERDIYLDMVNGMKANAGWPDEHKLALGYTGFLRLVFRRGKAEKRGMNGTATVTIALHHGFGGGKRAGSKANNMEQWLWTTECDLGLMGHVHVGQIVPVAVSGVNRAGHYFCQTRKGAYTGTCLKSVNEDGEASYGEVKGFPALPLSHVEVRLRPGADDPDDRIQIATGGFMGREE